jgi:parvulin-like peptidyl-prolyl isomerase
MSRIPRETTALALGAVAGLVLIAVGLAGGPRVPAVLAPAGAEPAAAIVNGVAIPRSSIERFVDALDGDRPAGPGSGVDRARLAGSALERAIDDELLLQRALALELPRKDFLARRQLVKTLIEAVVREAEASEPSAAAIESAYAEAPEFFRRPGRTSLRQMLFRERAAEQGAPVGERVDRAVARLAAGESFGDVAADLGDPAVIPLPAAPLTPTELREYLGPTATAAAQSLEVGRVSEPIRSSAGVMLLIVDQRQPGEIPPLAEVREQALGLARRRAGERALTDYLAELRARATVEVDDARVAKRSR